MSSIGLRSRGAAYAPGAIAYSISHYRRRVLVLLLASAMMTPAFGKGSSTAPGHRHPSPHGSASSDGKHHGRGSVHKGERSEHAAKSRILPDPESARESGALESSADMAATKQAIALLRHRKFSEAAALAATIDDPVARKLVEWVMLRDSDSPANFDRYAAFMQSNADWPSIPALRRRAEARLWQERREPSTVPRFLCRQPVSAIGRPALPRVVKGGGDPPRAPREGRGGWQSAGGAAGTENAVAHESPPFLPSPPSNTPPG